MLPARVRVWQPPASMVHVEATETRVTPTVSAFAAAVYVVATVALARPGPRWHRLATAAVAVELLGVLGVGLLSVLVPALFPEPSVWSHFGQDYGYVPLVLPVVGLAWLRRSRPRGGRAPA